MTGSIQLGGVVWSKSQFAGLKAADPAIDAGASLAQSKRHGRIAPKQFANVFRQSWGSAVRCGGPSVRRRPGGVGRPRSARRCPTNAPFEYASVFLKWPTRECILADIFGSMAFAPRHLEPPQPTHIVEAELQMPNNSSVQDFQLHRGLSSDMLVWNRRNIT